MTSILPYGGPQVPALLDSLTERERDVLELACDGYSFPEIAEELHVQPETVKVRMAKVRGKLQARNIAHAVAIAIRSGLIEAAA